ELTPEVADLVGLLPDPTAGRLIGPKNPTLAFRDFGGGEPAQFVCKMRSLARTTTSSARAKVRIERQQLQVEQLLEYRVAHEPQQTFAVSCPSGKVPTGDWQASLNDQPLAVSPIAPPKTNDDGLEYVQISVPTEQ